MKDLKNYITDVGGVLVGHAQNAEAGTGCTAVIFPGGAVAGADVRGGAPGTREIDAMEPTNIIDRIHGIYLGGGSAFGLNGAEGVMAFLEEHKIGFDTGSGIVPIVPGAVIFDLAVGDGTIRPDKDMGYEAAKSATASESRSGNIGVGTGASAGKHFGLEHSVKTGLGGASMRAKNIIVSALAVVNPRGDVVDPVTGRIIAGAYDRAAKTFLNTARLMCENPDPVGPGFTGNTTIGVIVTNAALTKAQARRVAMMAHDGFARAINPIHTMYDGDTIFCASTGTEAADLTVLGVMAAEVMARAIIDAAKSSAGKYGMPGYEDLSPVSRCPPAP